MIRILQDQEHGHRNNCSCRFRVRDRRYRGQNLRMAPGRPIWPIHRSTLGPKWVTGLGRTGRAPAHAASLFGLHVPRLPNISFSLLGQRQILAREPPHSRGGGG